MAKLSAKRCESGFSLVELLIAIGLSSMIAVMLFAGFRSSIHLWQKIETKARIDFDWMRFSQEFAHDVRLGREIILASKKALVLWQGSQYVKWTVDSTAAGLTVTRMTSPNQKTFRKRPGDVIIKMPHGNPPLSLSFKVAGSKTVVATLRNGHETFTLRESFRPYD
ncbi:MAG: prepilin-type N-terminal cleavage/methylation domain-containing protein [candidate division KSB1 bacterium]|nr:prepilin-type N-terminal cleavage/methylation domain-containing protein [candidate division KSB1 bacterium]MDQ7062856.1 prepilin-type N-terminal cleavage/methylation domain-containing protein [candidate division KSB1 bacterium]